MDEYEKELISSSIESILVDLELDDLFRVEDCKAVWISDPSVYIHIFDPTFETDLPVVLTIEGYKDYGFDSFFDALVGFIGMFMSCASDMDTECDYGQVFRRGQFGVA